MVWEGLGVMVTLREHIAEWCRKSPRPCEGLTTWDVIAEYQDRMTKEPDTYKIASFLDEKSAHDLAGAIEGYLGSEDPVSVAALKILDPDYTWEMREYRVVVLTGRVRILVENMI